MKKLIENSAHPLMNRPIRPILSWDQWLQRWEAVETTNEMISLLHRGFDVPMNKRYGHEEYTHEDRVLFYLGIADGWHMYASDFEKPDDQRDAFCVGYDKNGNDVKKTSAGLRKEITEKAFAMLCIHFFKLDNEGKPLHPEFGKYREVSPIDWFIRSIITEKLFPGLLHFFRLEPPPFLCLDQEVPWVRNLRRGSEEQSNYERHLSEFLVQLAHVLWKWKEVEIKDWWAKMQEQDVRRHNSRIRTAITQAQPWMIHALKAIGRLEDVLDGYVKQLNNECLEALRLIAMSRSLEAPLVLEKRKVVTLDEAVLSGSSAARLLKKRELLDRELPRLQQIKNLQETQRDTERQLKSLEKAGKAV